MTPESVPGRKRLSDAEMSIAAAAAVEMPTKGPIPEKANAGADDARVAQQALAASLTEIIDDVLRTRRFAVRAVYVC